MERNVGMGDILAIIFVLGMLACILWMVVT